MTRLTILPVRATDPFFLLWLIPNTHGALGFQDASEIPAHESPVEGWSLGRAFARLRPVPAPKRQTLAQNGSRVASNGRFQVRPPLGPGDPAC